MSDLSLTIERLIPGGHGLAFHQGRAHFVPLTAPGDMVTVAIREERKDYLLCTVQKLLAPGPDRIPPFCPAYGRCGGCDLQHLNPMAYQQAKMGFVIDPMRRIARLPEMEIPLLPIQTMADPLGYRCRAGLKLRWLNDQPLLGFYETGSHRIVDLTTCPLLHPDLQRLFPALRNLLPQLRLRDALPQVDAVAAESGVGLLFHLLHAPGSEDRERLRQFARENQLAQVWIQQGRKEGLVPLWQEVELTYVVAENTLSFLPGDFTQVNFSQNRYLVEKAMALVGTGEKAMDLFAGIGNFTLPLAKRFREVVGVEGYGPAVRRGRENGRRNGLANLSFREIDLFRRESVATLALDGVDSVLLDPPREGAVGVVKRLVAAALPRVVMVSCNPATLARDSAILLQGGYHLHTLQPVDMFPFSHHTEVVAGFSLAGD